MKLLNRPKRWLWSYLANSLNLNFRLSSGHHVIIRSYSDWCVYGDLFANGEYDPAINCVLNDNIGSSINVLDLGANTGFFALRLAHLATISNVDPSKIYCLCVEASPSTFRDLSLRLLSLRRKGFKIDSINCAAGKLHGYAHVLEARSSSLNNISFNSGRWTVPFKDFNDFPSNNNELHLLKCDIEGAESLFLPNHEQLLKRTKCCILECHPPNYTLDQADTLMRVAGLVQMGILRSTEEGVTVWYKRP
jgi:FkbM family methyltransferase